MYQVLAIIAVIAAALLFAGLLARAVLGRLVGRLGQSVEEMLQAVTLAPPIRIHLERVDHDPWRAPERARRAITELADLGFEDAGTFRVRETDLVLKGMVSTKDATLAAIFETPAEALHVDLATPYLDGALFTTSTAPASALPRPDNMPVRHVCPDPGPAALHEAHMAQRPGGSFEPTVAEDFSSVFERSHARAMEHVVVTGLADDHVRAIARSAGIDVSDAVIQRTRRAFQMQAEIELLESLRLRFLDQSDLTASEWESMRDEVVFVHDRMTEDHVVGTYAEALDPEDDDGAESLELTAGAIARNAPPRDAFARLNQTLPEARAFQRIGEIDGPIRADVYRQRAA